MLLLLGLLALEGLALRAMIRSPFTPWLLLAWPAGLWVMGWTLASIGGRLVSPRRRALVKGRR
jgi:hypothetical protein